LTRARLAWALLPAVGLLELAGQLWASRRAPRFDDYAALRSPVHELARAGDLVVVAPRWAEPMVRRALGDETLSLADLARSDVDRYDRAVEISVLGERSSELSGFVERGARRVGPFVVRELENPAPKHVVYDFVDHVRPPDAKVFGTDPPVDCVFSEKAPVLSGGLGGHPTFPAARFLCPGGEFFNVGPTVIADERFLPRRCIWSHPFARGWIVTRFSQVPLGDRIVGHSGMYWIIERNLAGAPIELEIAVDGDVVGRVTHVDGQGWAPFEVPLGAHAHAHAADVEFRVSSPNYVDRHFCFEASSR
jgi:hypothetical protein